MRLKEILIENMYTAYVLSVSSRRILEKHFPPKYSEFIGHHVTEEFGVSNNAQLPEQPSDVSVVGYVDSGDGLETLIVSINGNTKRPDGNNYHITWSLDREAGYKPVHSNRLIEENGYKKVTPVQIEVVPALLK